MAYIWQLVNPLSSETYYYFSNVKFQIVRFINLCILIFMYCHAGCVLLNVLFWLQLIRENSEANCLSGFIVHLVNFENFNLFISFFNIVTPFIKFKHLQQKTGCCKKNHSVLACLYIEKVTLNCLLTLPGFLYQRILTKYFYVIKHHMQDKNVNGIWSFLLYSLVILTSGSQTVIIENIVYPIGEFFFFVSSS